jgi:hypothetical protein
MGWFSKEEEIDPKAIAAEEVKRLHDNLISENEQLRNSLRRYRALSALGAGYIGYNIYKDKKKRKSLKNLLGISG